MEKGTVGESKEEDGGRKGNNLKETLCTPGTQTPKSRTMNPIPKAMNPKPLTLY
jgi:hypothetical protein